MNRNFQTFEVNGITIRAVVEGSGPLIVLLHGWPQSWYLWRHQIDPLVAAGYCVVVPDQRGFGGSSKPRRVADYHIKELTADIEGIRETLGYDDYIVIGQDWGCLVAWSCALLYPQTCRAVMGLSVPFWKFTELWVDRPGSENQFWYMRYFQSYGDAEAELDVDVERSLRTLYYALSADSPFGTGMKQLESPATAKLLDALPEPGEFSGWLTPEDLNYYVQEYAADGFSTPINWYRNIKANAEYFRQQGTLRFSQPAAFGIGEFDDVGLYDPEWADSLPADFDDLRFMEIINGAGHWVQAEAPKATNEFILKFLAGL